MIDIALKKSLQGGARTMLLDFKASIQPGEIIAIYGPSGAGKSSIIRMIAGLMRPDEGRIGYNNQVWFNHQLRINLATQRRNIGVVFQDAALFPHMSVRENIDYGRSSDNADNNSNELLQLMDLHQLADMRPALLSGGQKQRVALARAIMRNPELLLLDEPTSAMDVALRMKMQDYILEVHRRFGMTIIVVTHDILEIVRLAQRVVILDEGKVTATGKPSEVLPIKQLRSLMDEL